MESILNDNCILIKTKNNKGVLFFNPQIFSNSVLKFENNTCGVDSYFDINKKKIFLKVNKEILALNLGKEDIEFLTKIHKDELEKAKLFYKNISYIMVQDNSIFTKELIDTCFNEYYLKLFIYSLRNRFKIKTDSFNEIQKILLNKINLDKYNDIYEEDYGKYKLIPLKDIK